MISKNHTHGAGLTASIRMALLLFAVLTLCAALTARPAHAAEWMQPYLEQVQEWGVMRGDGNGNLNEDRTITRAEFVTLVNRAFGFTEVGDSPFTDVSPNAWYAEDISIAHKAGYFNGTSANTASPLSPVTREQAAVLLGRCLRLQGTAGVSASTFNDIESIGGWSRGLIQEAADLGIIQGYGDGTFRPSEPITRGQMACFLVRALGTLIQEPGEQSSGGVYGNLTINVPGVKLKDTTITGNLYLTGGVGLGDLELENVTVLGKIVISGSGEAEHGKNSITLRNVTAGGLEVDSLMNQFLSIRAEGLTTIDNTIVRTSAYVEDLTEDGLGLKLIRLDGAEGVRLQLAGNIKEVLNLTPRSTLQLAQGLAGVVTMDEKAVGATLTIDVDSVIKELNLDTATPVTGAGSITRLNVNAAGSNVSMLPDTVYVRPGINSTVANQTMDNKAANESSEEPRLLAGYPAARNIAPTSADAVFRANKPGTIRWALTALMDGSLGEEDLLNPAANAKVIRSGTINAAASNTDFTARLTGLTREGSYYISALLEDARGHRSPVKVAAFTTPDDTAPAFAAGYPENPILTVDNNGEQVAQIKVMATKSCQLYYVLLPKNSTAPTAAGFRAAAIPGSLGSGVITLQKNTPFLISRINSSHLAEKTDYDLYLWLSDADNGKSSAVLKRTVTTKDITPPNIISLYVKSQTATSVTMAFTLDEPGTLSWAAAAQGASIGVNKTNPSQTDQIRIESIGADGKTVIRVSGNNPARAAQGNTEFTFNVNGLQAETSYDLYYSFKDSDGNYGIYNETIQFPLPIRTQDNNPPTAKVWLSRPDPDNDSETLRYTLLDGHVGVEFSEIVLGYETVGEVDEAYDFLALYQKVTSASSAAAKAKAKADLASAIKEHITLYPDTATGNNEPTQNPVPQVTGSTSQSDKDRLPMWINYEEAVVVQAEGKTRIYFPSGTGIKLQSGRRYTFHVKLVRDTAPTPNKLTGQNVTFATASARVDVGPAKTGYMDNNGQSYTMFQIEPKNTVSAPQDARWDMIIWAEATINFELYVRRIGDSDWISLGVNEIPVLDGQRAYRTLAGSYREGMIRSGFFGMSSGQGLSMPYLNDLTENLEFGIRPNNLSRDVKMSVEIITSDDYTLQQVARFDETGLDGTINRYRDSLEYISNPKTYSFTVPTDSPPTITLSYHPILIGSSKIRFDAYSNMAGTVYAMAIPVEIENNDPGYRLRLDGEQFLPKLDDVQLTLEEIPDAGKRVSGGTMLQQGFPDTQNIYRNYNNYAGSGVRWGTATYSEAEKTETINITGLDPKTTYILYLVGRESINGAITKSALCYQFTTAPALPARIGASTNDNLLTINVDPTSQLRYIFVEKDALDAFTESIFLDELSKYIDPDKAYIANGFDTSMTVLKAMQTPASDSRNTLDYADTNSTLRNSLFDLCATKEAKQTFFAAINNSGSDNNFPRNPYSSVKDPQSRLSANSSILSDNTALTGLDAGVTYYLLVVALPGGTGGDPDAYGFYADLYTNGTRDPFKVIMATYRNNTLTIGFNDEAWCNYGGGRYQIDGCRVVASHDKHSTNADELTFGPSDGYVSIYALVLPSLAQADGYNPEWSLVSPTTGHKISIGGTSWSFKLTGTLAPGEAVELHLQNICDSRGYLLSDGRGNNYQDYPITIRNVGTDGSDKYEVSHPANP